MAIGGAIQHGRVVYVFDRQQRWILTIPLGDAPASRLKGYTPRTVSVRSGNAIYTYDEKGRLIERASCTAPGGGDKSHEPRRG